MPINFKTRRLILWGVAGVACLLAGGFAFVSYFMHEVYEKEQPLGVAEIPAAVRLSFEKHFPDATQVEWEFDDNYYDAEFRWQGQKDVEAHFSADGTLLRSVYPIRFSDLPEKARLYLESQDGYKAIEPERIQPAGSPPIYETKLANKLMEWDCQFDAEGNLIARIRDGPVLE